MSKLTEYARNELDRLMSNNDDGMQSLMNQNILDLIEMFSEQGFFCKLFNPCTAKIDEMEAVAAINRRRR